MGVGQYAPNHEALMMRFAFAAVTAFFVLAPLSAGAADSGADPDTNDVRCVIVYIEMAQSNQPLLQTSGMYGQLYWIGKLDGRDPKFDLEKRMAAEIPKMNGAFLKTEALRCSTELMKRGQKEADMGEDLAKKFPKDAPKPLIAAPAAKPAAPAPK